MQTIVIVIIAFLVYSNTLNHSFVLDDDVVFLKNQFVQEGISGIPDILSHGFLYGFNQKNDQSYRPIVLVNYAILKSLFGNNASFFHFMNVAYFCLACLLLFYWLNLVFKEQYYGIAFWASILFSLHPIHTEVVANIKGADELLHFIFALCTLIFYQKYIEKNSLKFLLWSLLSFILALFSKEIALSLLFIAPLMAWTFNRLNLLELLKKSWPLLVVVVFYFILRQMVLDTITFEEDMKVINNGLAAASSYSDQLATTFYIFSEYVKLLFIPHPLAWDYSYPHFGIVDFTNLRVIITTALLAAAILLSLLGLRKRSILSAFFLLFCAGFALTSNFFILIGSTLGERFLFFPSIAWVVIIPISILLLFQKLSKAKKLNTILYAVPLVTICLLFALKTFSRNKDWKNNEALFVSGAIATPNNARAQSALASTYRIKGEASSNLNVKRASFDQAIEAYKKSLSLLPENADAAYNLGVTYMNYGKQNLAKEAYKQSLSIDSTQINALNNLGVIHFQNGQLNEAEFYFMKCLKINLNFQSAYANLGAVNHNRKNYEKAKMYYEEALRLNPNDINTRNNYQRLP